MKVRVLTEQHEHHSQPDRHHLASGAEVDLPAAWARDLLNAGEAEPVARKPSERAEKRPAKAQIEKRG